MWIEAGWGIWIIPAVGAVVVCIMGIARGMSGRAREET